MFRSMLIAGLASVALLSVPATAAELIHKMSPHSVAQTMDRLEAAVTGAGATVFARINHGAGAQKIGSDLAEAEVLIFGNPKLGTPAMQADIAAGLDLPLRVLVHADTDGKTHVVYRAPATLADDHAIPGDAQVLQMMTGALDKLTGKAVATE